MNQNLEKYTKAELISKLKNINKEKLESKIDSTKIKQANEVKNKSENKNNTQPTIWDIIWRIKIYLLSLSIIAILTKIFSQYKSIRAILKLANYIIITMFGLSIFEAFGLGFIVKFLGELKYIFGAVVAYLTDSTFYSYLMTVFNINEENQSVRTNYKKPIEKIDWKAEFEKAERQRDIDKWKEKYEKHQEDGMDKKTIALLLLLLGGTITTWYYGPELLNIISPIWNLSELIRSILRGRNPGDDTDDDIVSVILENKSNLTPDASNSNHLNTIAPTAPPAPPPPPTNEGPPAPPTNPFLADIQKGTKLKKAVTVVRDNLKTGKVIEKDEGGMMEHLKNSLDKLRPMVTGDDSEIDIPKSGDNWEDSGEITPTNTLDKGKGKEVETHSPARSISPDMLVYSSSSDKSADKQDLLDRKKQKFLDSINFDGDNIKTSSKIAPILREIKENFPNLSDETLEKLSTKEGLENRKEILESLSEKEIEPLTKLINKGKSLTTFEDLKDEYKKELEKESLNHTLELQQL